VKKRRQERRLGKEEHRTGAGDTYAGKKLAGGTTADGAPPFAAG
jgi:hypothetical protein